jgi:hypothetical protein
MCQINIIELEGRAYAHSQVAARVLSLVTWTICLDEIESKSELEAFRYAEES